MTGSVRELKKDLMKILNKNYKIIWIAVIITIIFSILFSYLFDRIMQIDDLFEKIDNFIIVENYEEVINLISSESSLNKNKKIIAKKNEILAMYKNSFLTRANNYLSENNFDEALILLEEAHAYFGDNIDIANMTNEVIAAKNEYMEAYKQTFLNKSADYLANKKYDEALEILRIGLNIFLDDIDILAKIDKVSTDYKANFLLIADNYFLNKEYAKALDELIKAKNIFNDDNEISAKTEEISFKFKDYIFTRADNNITNKNYDMALAIMSEFRSNFFFKDRDFIFKIDEINILQGLQKIADYEKAKN